MIAGVEITNDSGSFVLDANMAHPSLLSKGTATTVANTTVQIGGSQCIIEYAALSANPAPICVVRPPAGAAVFQHAVQLINGSYRWTFISNGAVGTLIPYWIFDRPASTPSGGGLEIYDETSARIFHSGRFPLRVKAPLITSNVTVTILPNAETFTFTTGRSYGAFFGRLSGFRKYFNAGAGNVRLRAYWNGFEAATNGLKTVNMEHSAEALTTNPDYSREREWLPRFIIPVDLTDY